MPNEPSPNRVLRSYHSYRGGSGYEIKQFVLQMEAIEIVMNSYQSKLSVEFITILSQGNYHIR